MYGRNLNAYKFLLTAKYLPENYDLWEDIEVMKEEGPWFHIEF